MCNNHIWNDMDKWTQMLSLAVQTEQHFNHSKVFLFCTWKQVQECRLLNVMTLYLTDFFFTASTNEFKILNRCLNAVQQIGIHQTSLPWGHSVLYVFAPQVYDKPGAGRNLALSTIGGFHAWRRPTWRHLPPVSLESVGIPYLPSYQVHAFSVWKEDWVWRIILSY